MTHVSNDEFANRVMETARPVQPFQPTAIYDPDGDCLEFLASPEPFFAERVDDVVTVYYSQRTREVIGSLLKGASKFCEELLRELPGFRIEIHDGRVKLEHIFRARLWSSPNGPEDFPTLTYRKLLAIAANTDVEAEFCGV